MLALDVNPRHAGHAEGWPVLASGACLTHILRVYNDLSPQWDRLACLAVMGASALFAEVTVVPHIGKRCERQQRFVNIANLER